MPDPIASALIVRPVVEQDFAAWLPLWDGYNAFYGREGATALDAEVTRTSWARFLDPHEPMFALVAEHEGALVGLAHCLYHRSTTAIAPTCYLQDLFTASARRGLGVGRTLIEAAFARAQAEGAGRFYWQTHETNHTAMRLYDQVAEKSGFVVYRKLA
jgi:GNAT superfamily N-acetyltransferase